MGKGTPDQIPVRVVSVKTGMGPVSGAQRVTALGLAGVRQQQGSFQGEEGHLKKIRSLSFYRGWRMVTIRVGKMG